MENKFKQSINLVIKEILSIPTHSVEYIKEELQIIYLNKYYLDKNGFKFLNEDLSYDISEIKDENILRLITKFFSVSKFNFDDKKYESILKIINTIDFTQIFMTEYDMFQMIEMSLNDEINNQMSMVMNAVKGLRQSLYQNGYATGVEAYKETIRMLFLRMIEDKKLKSGDLDKQFYVFSQSTLKNNFANYQKTHTGKETLNDYFNFLFRDEVLNLDKKQAAQYAIYSKLFKNDEVIISNATMINDFINKLNGINIVDLMDAGKDVLGVVYESYIGDVQNSGAGQIFTPTDVVDFMVEIAKLNKDDVCLDFCSGSGRFMTSAMRSMIKDARATITNHKELEEKIDHIKHNQVYGADLDSNPTLNTKRNMALAGDGSSHIANMNSLFIQHKEDDNGNVTATFINGMGVNDKDLVGDKGETFDINNCSWILTNPPFGDLTLNQEDYSKEWIDELRETFNKACKSELNRWKPRFEDLIKKGLENEDLEDLFEELDDLIDLAPLKRDTKVENSFEKMKDALSIKDKKKADKALDDMFKVGVRTVSTKYKTNKKGEEVLDGTTNFKGCLLFLYKAYQILKVGGNVLIVVDDGVLNTDTYAFARDFIRNKFYINAIFSLSDKAFYAHSDKTIKTSILYLTKKEETIDKNGDVFTEKQTAPTFYAHVEKTGQNSKRGKYESHFSNIIEGYFDFVNKVNINKEENNGVFNPKTFYFDEVTIKSQTSNDEEDNEVVEDDE